MTTEQTDEFNLAEIRSFLHARSAMNEKPLEESLTDTLAANAFISVYFRPCPDGFICEIADGAVTWAGWGKTIRAAYNSALSRNTSK